MSSTIHLEPSRFKTSISSEFGQTASSTNTLSTTNYGFKITRFIRIPGMMRQWLVQKLMNLNFTASRHRSVCLLKSTGYMSRRLICLSVCGFIKMIYFNRIKFKNTRLKLIVVVFFCFDLFFFYLLFRLLCVLGILLSDRLLDDIIRTGRRGQDA